MPLNSVFVTLEYQSHIVDLELPYQVPFTHLIQSSGEALKWFDTALESNNRFVGLIKNVGQIIRQNDQLQNIDATDGAIIQVKPAFILAKQSREFHNPQDYEIPDFPLLFAKETAQIFPLKGNKIDIGRSPTAAISLENLPSGGHSSRIHAHIYHSKSYFSIQDNQSTNGTIVDEFVLSSNDIIYLRSGSHIQFGKSGPIFVFFN